MSSPVRCATQGCHCFAFNNIPGNTCRRKCTAGSVCTNGASNPCNAPPGHQPQQQQQHPASLGSGSGSGSGQLHHAPHSSPASSPSHAAHAPQQQQQQQPGSPGTALCATQGCKCFAFNSTAGNSCRRSCTTATPCGNSKIGQHCNAPPGFQAPPPPAAAGFQQHHHQQQHAALPPKCPNCSCFAYLDPNTGAVWPCRRSCTPQNPCTHAMDPAQGPDNKPNTSFSSSAHAAALNLPPAIHAPPASAASAATPMCSSCWANPPEDGSTMCKKCHQLFYPPPPKPAATSAAASSHQQQQQQQQQGGGGSSNPHRCANYKHNCICDSFDGSDGATSGAFCSRLCRSGAPCPTRKHVFAGGSSSGSSSSSSGSGSGSISSPASPHVPAKPQYHSGMKVDKCKTPNCPCDCSPGEDYCSRSCATLKTPCQNRFHTFAFRCANKKNGCMCDSWTDTKEDFCCKACRDGTICSVRCHITGATGVSPHATPHHGGSSSPAHTASHPSASASSSPAPPPGGRKTRALLVGNNYAGTKSALSGCINDIKTQLKVLEHANFLQEKRVLVDGPGVPEQTGKSTKKEILEGLEWLVDGALNHGVTDLWYNFSGHGGGGPSRSYLCPTDYAKAGVISHDEVHAFVKRLPKGCRLTAVIDACHSEKALNLEFLWHWDADSLKFLGVPPLKTRDFSQVSKAHVDADVMSISGCKINQTSADVSSVASFKMGNLAGTKSGAGGALTSAFAEAFYQRPNMAQMEVLYRVQDCLEKRSMSQTPQMQCSKDVDMRKPFSFFGTF